MVTHQFCLFQVLGGLSAGRLRFFDMQQEVYMLRKEHEEALRMAAKYQYDLKEVDKRVKRKDSTILEVDKVRNHVHELKWALLATVRERDSLKVQVEGIGASFAKA